MTEKVSVALDTNKRRIQRLSNKLIRRFESMQCLPRPELVLSYSIERKEHMLDLLCRPVDKEFFRSFIWGYVCGLADR